MESKVSPRLTWYWVWWRTRYQILDFEGLISFSLGIHRCHTPSKRFQLLTIQSLLRYSFRTNHAKSCSIIDYDLSNGKSVIEKVELNLPRGMARLSGSSVQDILENTDFDKHVDDWVEVTLPWSEEDKSPSSHANKSHTPVPITSSIVRNLWRWGYHHWSDRCESVGEQPTTRMLQVKERQPPSVLLLWLKWVKIRGEDCKILRIRMNFKTLHRWSHRFHRVEWATFVLA